MATGATVVTWLMGPRLIIAVILPKLIWGRDDPEEGIEGREREGKGEGEGEELKDEPEDGTTGELRVGVAESSE